MIKVYRNSKKNKVDAGINWILEDKEDNIETNRSIETKIGFAKWIRWSGKTFQTEEISQGTENSQNSVFRRFQFQNARTERFIILCM